MEFKVTTMGDVENEAIQNTEANPEETTPPNPESGEGQDETPDTSATEIVEGQGLDANAVKVVEPEVAPEVEENTAELSLNIPDETPETPSVPEKAAQPTQSWQDIIKNIPKKDLAKAIGLSDFALEIDEHISKGGQAIDYLNAKAIDYTKVPDADLIKDSLRKELPNASNAQLDLLISRKYSQGEFAEDEDKEIGLLTMQMDANKIRQERIAKQQSFKIPETPIANTADIEQQQQAARQQAELEAQTRIEAILNHEATRNLITNKRVVIDLGEGNKPFNFKLDDKSANYLNRLITDGETYSKAVHNDKGEPKVELMQKIAMQVANPNYEKDIYNAGKEAMKREMVEENQNIGRPKGSPVIEMKPAKFAVKGTGTIGSH